MYDAWLTAYHYYNSHPRDATRLDELLIHELGGIVEPEIGGFYRQTPVLIRGRALADAHLIPSAIANLVRSEGLTPDEWYKEFEEIHPFKDGNGRVGLILFHYLRGTLHDPDFVFPNVKFEE